MKFRPSIEALEDRWAPATLPAGFSETTLAQTLQEPTAFELAPDGRVFILEQTGSVRVISDSQLLPTPFVHLNVDSSGERGLLGITFDPDFANNHFVYLYYTTPTAPIHNRVSRFVADGNVAQPGSETPIVDLDNLSVATNHNGGAIHFGPDGKLYIGVGENGNGTNAQTLSNRLGKILRVNKDGSIPSDNPFIATATGVNRSIWAMGLRNPFTFAFQPGTGQLFINDVGAGSFEEINDGIAGSNYGWPTVEGYSNDPRFRSPLFAYAHGSNNDTGIAITGGTFYNPPTVQFPQEYVGTYFFADLGNGWIRRYDPASGAVTLFASGLPFGTVDLKVASVGSLLYLNRGTGSDTGQLVRIAGPLTPEQQLVSHLYGDLLQRSPAPAESNYWVGQLPQSGRAGVAAAILHSSESLGLLVQGYYSYFLNRGADPAGTSFWVNQLANGMTAEQVITGFLSSPEFTGRANSLEGTSDADTNYVRALYDLLLRRTAGTNELDYWHSRLPALGRSAVASDFLTSQEFRADTVRTLYGQPSITPLPFFPNLLKRQNAPTATEVVFWVGSSLDLLGLETAFGGSNEYFSRV